MSRVQIHCHGCNRAFTPHGFSQHINRTQLLSCHAQRAAIQLPTTCQTQGSNLVANPGPTSWDHSEFSHHGDTAEAVGCEDTAAKCKDTAANCEDAVADTSDLADTIDADLLEILVQNFGCCTNPHQEHSVSPDQLDQPPSRSPPSDPAQPLHSNPSDTNPSDTNGPLQDKFGSSIWAPFRSQCDWEIMRWAKMWGPTLLAVTNILAIPEVIDELGLSYHMPNELNKIIDGKLPGHPQFKCKDMTIAGITLQFYFHNILQCIWTLYGNPEFARDLVFVPEHHYTDHEWTCCMYSKMHTSNWWWAVQTSLEAHQPGTTVVPVVLSSDKTQLTLFHGKAAYPVYLMIGNLSRHTQMLIGYIPTAHLEGIGNKSARQHALANIFHFCMRNLLAPIVPHSEMGIAMMSGDGVWCRCHPIFAMFISDYTEQALVTCTFNGWCPKCIVHHDDLGDYSRSPPHGDIHAFHSVCHEASLKPVFHPFWEALPLTDIFVSITHDILHQMLQGVMKHLVAWLIGAFGPAQIDVQFPMCLFITNHHVMTFARGISTLSRVSGLEHKNMCHILLGLVIELPFLSGGSPVQVIRTVRVLLDFLYLMQLPSHTTETLLYLEDLLHYKSSITLFGSTDNYNMEQTEWLHIDFMKDAYHATNHKDKYPQMTTWLERQPIGPSKPVLRAVQMAQNPSLKAVSFNDLTDKYRAFDFQDALANFIAQLNHPQASTAVLRALAEDTLLPFRHVPVFHKIKFASTPDPEVIDVVHVQPDQRDAHGHTIPSRFDTVIVRSRPQDSARGNKVHVVFQLPRKVLPQLFLSMDVALPTHLAYMEWFSPIPTTPNSNSRLFKVSRLTRNGQRLASVIPVDDIYSSVHLLPRFGQLGDTPRCNTFLVLELCQSFYINLFSSQDIYLLFL
ncbi:hypothetical protein H4582DRAFT_2114026 [Lactarius indigo]|nr:hypothetical protein H4582DRAFT_2114026 [Lactarius indigo]